MIMKSNSGSPFKFGNGNADIQSLRLQPDSSDPFLCTACRARILTKICPKLSGSPLAPCRS